MANEKRLDLIDRKALGIGRCNPDAFPLQNRGYVAGWNGVISLLEQAPTVDAVEMVHGRWIFEAAVDEGRADYKCSVCDYDDTFYCNLIDAFYNYCPNCGASMRDGDGNGT